jgi:hypothetical protein
VLAAIAAAPAEEAAKPEAAKPDAKPTAAPRPAAAPAATQLAKVAPGNAVQAPVLASAASTPVAPAAPTEEKPLLQRALSFMPVFGGGSSATADQGSAPIASVVPATPTATSAPLPPRRATGLKTSSLDQSMAGYASQPTTR